MVFSINTNVVATYNDVADALINDLGVDCTLLYPPLRAECPNCYSRTIGIGSSANVYRPGGPIFFQQGRPCPLCNGKGFKLTENTEVVRMRVYWRKKDWVDIGFQVDIPGNVMQTIFFLSDLPKIMKAQQIIPNRNLQGFITARFDRASQPFPHGFLQDRYAIIFWNRAD